MRPAILSTSRLRIWTPPILLAAFVASASVPPATAGDMDGDMGGGSTGDSTGGDMGGDTGGDTGGGDFDCSFFREHARDRHPLDYAARMLAACEALAAYRENLLRETVRYAFGEQAAASRARVRERAAPLDTFHVLPEREQYRIATDSKVFREIIEVP